MTADDDRQARRRTRILFLIDVAVSTGGAERFAVGLATHLPPDRFEPWLCATRATDAEAEQALAAAGVKTLVLGRRTRRDVHRFSRLVTLVREQRFDVLHSHMFGSNMWGVAIGRACRVPVIVAQEHGWAFEGNAPRAWADGHVIGRLATRFVAVSRADGDRMVSHEGVPASKVVVMPNGYVPSPGTDTDVRGETGIEPTAPLIAVAAVLRPEKRLDVLLEAHAIVCRHRPDARLVLAGDGPCRAELTALAARLGLGDRVTFLGRRTDVDSILRAADICVLSSDREGSPLLMFECMAASRPLVATRVGGIPDVVQDGETGVLVPPSDPPALADALLRLIDDPDQRARMGAAAHSRLTDYTIDASAARYANLYDLLTESVNS